MPSLPGLQTTTTTRRNGIGRGERMGKKTTMSGITRWAGDGPDFNLSRSLTGRKGRRTLIYCEQRLPNIAHGWLASTYICTYLPRYVHMYIDKTSFSAKKGGVPHLQMGCEGSVGMARHGTIYYKRPPSTFSVCARDMLCRGIVIGIRSRR